MKRSAVEFVVFSVFDWSYHSHGHSDFQLAKALATDHKVLFVNTIGMRFPPLGLANAPIARARRKLKSISRGFWIPDTRTSLAVFTPPQIPFYSGIFGAVNKSALQHSVRRAMSRFGIHEFAAVVTLPTYAETAIACGPRSLIYNRSDRHSALKSADADAIKRLEALLLDR